MPRSHQLFHFSILLGTSFALLTTEKHQASQQRISTSTRQGTPTDSGVETNQSFQHKTKSKTELLWTRKKGECLCPEEDESSDFIEEQREALFSTMGALWAAGALPNAIMG